MSINQKIGFIGAGNMAEAMAGALVKAGVESSQITMSDVDLNRLDFMRKTYNFNITSNNFDVFMKNSVVILAIKPQTMNKVLTDLVSDPNYGVSERKLVISIAAGITIELMERHLYKSISENQRVQIPIIRVMPNTPALVLAGISAMAGNANVKPSDKSLANDILSAMGKVIEVSEQDINAVTAVSGSGPAYVFYFIESMIEAAKQLGFSDEMASILTIETFDGSLKLLKNRKESPEILRKKVTSPGGTTEAALKVMEQTQIKLNIIKAIQAAELRAKELTK